MSLCMGGVYLKQTIRSPEPNEEDHAATEAESGIHSCSGQQTNSKEPGRRHEVSKHPADKLRHAIGDREHAREDANLGHPCNMSATVTTRSNTKQMSWPEGEVTGGGGGGGGANPHTCAMSITPASTMTGAV